MSIYLREITHTDLPTIMRWVSNKHVTDGFGDAHKFVSEESTEKWYQNYLANKPRDLRLMIVRPDRFPTYSDLGNLELFTGCIYLLNHHPINRVVDLHMFIGDVSNWGKGYGSEAVNGACDYAFDQMGVQRIQLTVLETNTAAFKLYEKCGFEMEGIMRNAVFKNGGFHNMVMMAKFVD